MNRIPRLAAFLAGLAAVAWVGAGYVGSYPLALVMTALIAAFYVLGALDLERFRRATGSLRDAVAGLQGPPSDLSGWLDRLDASLRPSVRRRIEGESVALPAPALAPTIAGLLVLLGMLGTFLGMVLTLKGTGVALENATDLQAVRGSLVAPVKGLGLAFGTSVAGVATSAMLGLLSALARRERSQAVQALDGSIATTLRPHSGAQRRAASLEALQRQADVLPALVDRLQALTEALERRAEAADARLLARQEAFQAQAAAAYGGLAAAVDRSLKESLAESARLAGTSIAPAVEATLAGIAHATAGLQERLGTTVERQLEALATRFEAAQATAAANWESASALAAAQWRSASATAAEGWQAATTTAEATWMAAAERQERSSQRLVDGVDDALGRAAERHERGSQRLIEEVEGALGRFAQTFEARSTALVAGVAQHEAEGRAAMADAVAALVNETAGLQRGLAETAAGQLTAASARFEAASERVTQGWDAALARHAQASQQAATDAGAALIAASARFDERAAALLQGFEAAHGEHQRALHEREAARLSETLAAVEGLGHTLGEAWTRAGEGAHERQQAICDTLAETAGAVTRQVEAQARATIAEIGRLVDAAAEAPRAAADVIGELRTKLSDSMARDNALLDERARVLQTLDALLETVQQAAGEQRGAIDALVATSSSLLERVGERFGAQVDAQAGRLEAVAAQVTGSAVEVASLGEAFGAAVQQFAASNDTLVAHLERVDGSLGQSIARSDEQLAYYVAQAREVIDLSILSQQRILEDLQRLAARDGEARAAA